MTTAQAVGILMFLIGIAVGWAWRSWQFVTDRECANPKHVDQIDEE
jgi:hypothetical protein